MVNRFRNVSLTVDGNTDVLTTRNKYNTWLEIHNITDIKRVRNIEESRSSMTIVISITMLGSGVVENYVPGDAGILNTTLARRQKAD